MTDIAPKLLPCPRCGEQEHLYPAYRLDKDGKPVQPPYAIDCLGCGHDFTPRDGMDAIAAWNRRSSPSQVAPANPAQGVSYWSQRVDEWMGNADVHMSHASYRKLQNLVAEAAAIGAGGQAVDEAECGVRFGAEVRRRNRIGDDDERGSISKDCEHAAMMLVINAIQSCGGLSALSQPHPADERVVEAQGPVPTHECEFRIGQAVHLASPYPEDDPNSVYYVTGITWEHRFVPHRGWNIAIATAEELSKGHGQTDGFSPSDLRAIPSVKEGL